MGDYTRPVKKVLSNNGFTRKRHGKGDHDIWFNSVTNKTAVVDGQIKSRHQANWVMKQAGIDHKF